MSKRRAELEVSAGGIVFRRRRTASGPRSCSSGTPTTTGASPRGISRTASRRPRRRIRETAEETGPRAAGAAGTHPGHRLALPVPRPPHPQVLPLLPVREPRRRGLPRRRTRGSPTASGARWTRRSRPLSYDNARGVLKRAGEMVRTLVAVGADGRSRRPRRGAPGAELRPWPPIAPPLESRAALASPCAASAPARTAPVSSPAAPRPRCGDCSTAAGRCRRAGPDRRARRAGRAQDPPAGIPVVAYGAVPSR